MKTKFIARHRRFLEKTVGITPPNSTSTCSDLTRYILRGFKAKGWARNFRARIAIIRGAHKTFSGKRICSKRSTHKGIVLYVTIRKDSQTMRGPKQPCLVSPIYLYVKWDNGNKSFVSAAVVKVIR